MNNKTDYLEIKEAAQRDFGEKSTVKIAIQALESFDNLYAKVANRFARSSMFTEKDYALIDALNVFLDLASDLAKEFSAVEWQNRINKLVAEKRANLTSLAQTMPSLDNDLNNSQHL